jgi:lipid A ethanolaminephosphotransferase
MAPADTAAADPTAREARRWHPAWLVVGASAWMASAGNVALWRALAGLDSLHGSAAWLLSIGLGVAIAGALTALLSLFAWPRTLKPVVAFLLVGAAVGAHFMLSYGVVLDPGMMTNTLQTNSREAFDLLDLRFLATVLLLGVVPALVAWRLPLRRARAGRRILQNLGLLAGGLAVVVASLLLVFQPLASTMRNHKALRYLINPLNSLYSLGYVAAKPLRRDESTLLPIALDAKLGPPPGAAGKPPLLVLVIGETARSDHFGLNGYARDTTPELAQEDVASFRNAWSCGTSTATSLPCIFSHLGRGDFEDRRNDYEGLLDVLHRAGLAVLWIDNQSGCKGACARVPEVQTWTERDPTLCSGGECFDEIMLKGLADRIAQLPAERRARGVVVVMHQMGSHGPAYYKRSPPAYKRYTPECTSVALQDCTTAQVVNAYDNTIAYTDHFLAATIEWLKRRQDHAAAALLYVSDHGESLGEGNLYLHGLPYAIAPDAQKHVPWITWLSPAFQQRTGIKPACLRQRLDVPVSHDNYFHSVLGLLDVQTTVYQRALDAYAPCVEKG